MCTDKSFGVWMFQSLRRGLCLAALVLTLFLALPVGSGEAQTPVPSTLVQAATPMLSYLDWLIDPSGTLTVEDMAAPAQQAAFRPLNLEKMPRETGTVWLRFTLAPRVLDARPNTYLLDMGEGVPGTPTLYIPKHNVLNDTTEWQDFTPSQRSIFLMPDAQTSPVTAYIKMSGLPGLWFTPMLRTPHNAATALERLMRPAVIVMLGVVMLLCLLRSLTERGEWRFWTSLYTGAALLHSVWGVPTLLQGHVPMAEIASVLAPGVALMLLPHVGRHLMHTRDTARIIDVQYILLSLPGAALALLPLVPGFSWTIRYLDLWPLGTLLLVPTTLGAWLMGLAGARRFLLGCLLPPLATAAGIMGIGSTVPGPLLATAPLWGVALSALLIAGTAAASEYAATDRAAGAKPDSAFDPMHDPALRIVSPEELAQESAAPMPEPTLWEQNAPPRVPADSIALAWEEKLRGPLDNLLREGAALAECSLPPAARQYALAMHESARAMSTLFSEPLGAEESRAPDIDESGGDPFFDLQQILRDAHDAVASNAENKNIALSWFMPPHLANSYVGDGRRLALCISQLLESAVRATSRGGVQVAVRRVPESVDAGHLLFAVTDTGTGMPPHDRSSVALARAWELAAAHRGFLGVECGPHGASISFTVRLQVASAHGVADDVMPNVAAARTGAGDASGTVRFANSAAQGGAQRPDSSSPHQPNVPTSQASAARAAEASGPREQEQNGPLATSSLDEKSPSPHRRTAAGDGVFVAAASQGGATARAIPRIIIADDSLSNRQLLAFFLEGLPYQTQEARSPDEAVDLYVTNPAALIIFDGDMPEEDTLSAVGRIRAFEAEQALPAALVLALTTGESRWDALHEGGFTHALVKPVTRTGLRNTVQELLPQGTVPPHLGEGLLQPIDSAEAQSLLFPEYESAGILLPDHSAAEAKLMDPDDEEIIDTGEPLPDSAPPALSGNAAFSEPLTMAPTKQSAEGPASAASGGMPLPELNMPVPNTSGQDIAAQEAAPELRPPATAAEPEKSAADSEVEEAFVENVYPYPSHGAASAQAEAAKNLAPQAENAAQPNPVPVQRSAFGTAALRNASPDATFSEWVGEPMPVSKASLHDSATPATAGAAVSTLSQPVVADSGPMNASVPERDSGVRVGSSYVSVSPSTAVEWVGEPMPISKVKPVSVADAAVDTPASSALASPVSASPALASSVPAFSAPAFFADSAVSPVAASPVAVPPVVPAPTAPPLTMQAENVGSTHGGGAVNTPSRVADLLTPYTRASFADEAANELAAEKAVAAAESVSAAPPSSAFIPLSFEPVQDRAKAPVLSPTAAAQNVRSERLSLIPEESPLLGFIIAPEHNTAPAKAPQAAPAPNPPVAAAPATNPPVASAPATNPPVAAAPAPNPPAAAPSGPGPLASAAGQDAQTPAPTKVDSPIPIMLEEFDEAMRYARGGFTRNNIQAVYEAAVYIANRSETCGLRVLARMARCVGEAARAKDMEALNNLLPELETAVERNKIALLKK